MSFKVRGMEIPPSQLFSLTPQGFAVEHTHPVKDIAGTYGESEAYLRVPQPKDTQPKGSRSRKETRSAADRFNPSSLNKQHTKLPD